MVAHEQALLDMARRELAGQSHLADQPVRDLLAHPLPRPPESAD
jgi:hypothetical protein